MGVHKCLFVCVDVGWSLMGRVETGGLCVW
jgi:hypothetical protein